MSFSPFLIKYVYVVINNNILLRVQISHMLKEQGCFGVALPGGDGTEDIQKQMRMANRLVIRAVDRYYHLLQPFMCMCDVNVSVFITFAKDVNNMCWLLL
jgi:hypothetical protein